MVRAASAEPTVPSARPLESAPTFKPLRAPLRVSGLCAGPIYIYIYIYIYIAIASLPLERLATYGTVARLGLRDGSGPSWRVPLVRALARAFRAPCALNPV